MKNLFFLGFIGFSFLTLSPSHSSVLSEWQNYSNPNIMSTSFERNFRKLPLHGTLIQNQKLWANDYWPFRNGIINYRWNSPNPIGFGLDSPSKEQALSMLPGEIAALAPSEKLDLFNGNYDYPLKNEVDKRSSPTAPPWFGICNGWASAAINHNEPRPKILVNPDGVMIPFGSSDIKGLLSYYYAFNNIGPTHQMGRRCGGGRDCNEDLNAGAFHIVLSNKIALKQSSFIVDVERRAEVWNHAVKEFNTTVINANLKPSPDSAPNAVRRVRVKTEMIFVLEIEKNNWEPVLGTEDHIDGVVQYEYLLELDVTGRIVGGKWISNMRPDFLWTQAKIKSFKGNFVRLSELLNDH